MGQYLSVNLSCVDCGSRLMTQEDNEACTRIKSRDTRSIDLPDDLNDEITVFESPTRLSGKSRIITRERCKLHGISFEPNDIFSRQLSQNPLEVRVKELVASRVRTSRQHLQKLHEDGTHTETSTPSLATNNSFCASRYKTLSSNFSPISVNLVDSIRKSQAISCRSENTLENIYTTSKES